MSMRGRIPGIANNSLVTVLFDPREGETFSQIEHKALVVHQANNTVGLMWAGDEFTAEILAAQQQNNAQLQLLGRSYP
jgi:hypothetical protein